MKLTNKYNAPQPLYDAIKNDPYNKGNADFSVTNLIDSPRISALKKLHDSEIEEDVADRRHSLYGQVVHSILERSNTEGIVSKRFFAQIGGYTISGEIDRYHEGIIQDWKFVGEFTFVKEDGVPEQYKLQLNCLAYLMHRNGHEVKGLQSVPLYKDWSEFKAKRPCWFEVLDVPMMGLEATEEYLLGRIKAHADAKINLPLCTDKERWLRGECWAVMKEGRKSAVKLCASEKEANDLTSSLGKGHTITHRREYTRCERFCPVSKFCKQYQGEQE